MRQRLLIGLVLGVFIAGSHFFALDGGLFLDDHAHYANLSKGDWSFQSAVDAAELGVVGTVMDMWGDPGSNLRFFRPVAFWIMRAEYTLLGWPVNGGIGMHLFSLVWHWVAAVLVVTLAIRMLKLWVWALLAGIWFAVHPGNVVTVHWIACQTELMATVFVLSAVLCYGRWSGWWSAGDDAATHSEGTECRTRGPSVLLLVATMVFLSLGLGCRENAVIVTVVAFFGDFFFRRGSLLRRGRWAAYLVFTAVVLAYAAVRHHALGGFPVPGPPYLHLPGDPDFLPFVVTKFLYYVLGLFGYFPVLPVGGLVYLREHPGMFCLAVVSCAGPLLAASFVLRHCRGIWMAGVWLVAGIAVMAPIFASPHHLNLPMVGAARFLAGALALLAGRFGPGASPETPAPDAAPWPMRRRVAAVLVGLHVVLMPLGSISNGWIYRTATRVEDEMMREILTYDRPLRDGDHMFFVNIPMLAYYIKPALENRLGISLHGHILMLSPSLWNLGPPSTVEQIDDYSFTVELEGYDYMAGLAGEATLLAMEREEPFQTGDEVPSGLYNVSVLDANETGIAKLRFTFHRRLSDPRYHIYFGSRMQFAYPLPFGSVPLVSAKPGP